jgi:hypothetical protein
MTSDSFLKDDKLPVILMNGLFQSPDQKLAATAEGNGWRVSLQRFRPSQEALQDNLKAMG